MLRSEALRMIAQYSGKLESYMIVMTDDGVDYPCLSEQVLWGAVRNAIGMPSRWPDTGSEGKAMRWLGYIQGICAACGLYTLDELKEHSKNRFVP